MAGSRSLLSYMSKIILLQRALLPQLSGKPAPACGPAGCSEGQGKGCWPSNATWLFSSLTLMSITVSFALETGGICISPRPSNPGAKILPGMAMRPFFGISPSLLDDKVHL